MTIKESGTFYLRFCKPTFYLITRVYLYSEDLPSPAKQGRLFFACGIKNRHALHAGMPVPYILFIYKNRFHRVVGVSHDAEPSDLY